MKLVCNTVIRALFPGILAIIALGFAAAAFAQGAPPLTGRIPMTGSSAAVWQCSDYKSNGDGSWTAVKATTFNGVAIEQGAVIKPGSKFGDVDLAAGLNLTCARMKP